MNKTGQLYITIGKNVREMRKSKGLTLEELAEKVGRDWSFLSQIERGRSIPSIETLHLISHALEIPVSNLFNPSSSSVLSPKKKIDRYNPHINRVLGLLRECPEKDQKLAVSLIKRLIHNR